MQKACTLLAFLFLALVGLSCKQEAPKDIVIPFDFVKNQIIIDVFIGDNGPYTMIFDTGVTPSTIDLSIAKALGLPIDTSDAGLATGRGSSKIQLFPAVIPHLKMGDLQVDSLDAVTLDHAHIGKALGRPLHGILGYSLLADRIFQIDYAAKEIRFFDSSEDLRKTLGATTHLRKDMIFQEGDIIPIIDHFEINGRAFIASLDTGSSLEVEIYRHHFDPYQIPIDTTRSYAITGAQGKDKNIPVEIDKLALGDLVFNDIEAGVAEVRNTKPMRQGNIGNGFLKRFKVSFDYIGRAVFFEAY